MTSMRIVDVGSRVEPETLVMLEQEIGAVLPADYRTFLLENNGGRPEPCTFRVPSHEEQAFDVQILFGLARMTESSNLAWNFRQYRSRVGDDRLPIGCTDTNDLVLLELTGDSRGRVVFWDAMATSTREAFYEVSSSFREFLDGLRDIESSGHE